MNCHLLWPVHVCHLSYTFNSCNRYPHLASTAQDNWAWTLYAEEWRPGSRAAGAGEGGRAAGAREGGRAGPLCALGSFFLLPRQVCWECSQMCLDYTYPLPDQVVPFVLRVSPSQGVCSPVFIDFILARQYQSFGSFVYPGKECTCDIHTTKRCLILWEIIKICFVATLVFKTVSFQLKHVVVNSNHSAGLSIFEA